MRIRIAPEAQAQLEERKRWWQQHRDKAPDLFDREFEAVAHRIAASPASFPVFTEKGGRSIRRCLMPKTRCHLYFEILASRPMGHGPAFWSLQEFIRLLADGLHEPEAEARRAFVVPGRGVLQLGLGHRVKPQPSTCHRIAARDVQRRLRPGLSSPDRRQRHPSAA